MNRIHFSSQRPPLRGLFCRPKKFYMRIGLLRSLRSLAMTFGAVVIITSQALAASVTATPKNSSLLFQVKHDLGYTIGYFSDYTATLETADGSPDQIVAVKVQVATQSVNTRNDVRDQGLRSDMFLDSNKFPQAVFESASADGNEIKGNLTLKGVTHPMTVKAEKDPSGNLIIKGKFNRNDFGISYNRNLADKKKSIGDVVEITMEIKP